MKRINIETAKLTKEIGYDLGACNKYYYDGIIKSSKILLQDINNCYPAPYQAELQEWLRNKHGIIVLVEYCKFYEVPWSACIQKLQDDFIEDYHNFTNYEEALEQGLQEALKLIKNEQYDENP